VSANPPAPLVTDAISGALVSILGPWGALAALALKFGEPWVAGLIANAHTGVDPTPDEWNKLSNKIEITGESLIPQRPPLTVVAPAVV
jgi:hypothetical protein